MFHNIIKYVNNCEIGVIIKTEYTLQLSVETTYQQLIRNKVVLLKCSSGESVVKSPT